MNQAEKAAQKARNQARLEMMAEAVVPEAVEWVKEIRKYRIYQGKDQEYFRKARVGLGIVSGAIRLAATMENSRTNDLIEARMLAGGKLPAIGEGKTE